MQSKSHVYLKPDKDTTVNENISNEAIEPNINSKDQWSHLSTNGRTQKSKYPKILSASESQLF